MSLTAGINNKKMLLLKPFSVSGVQCMSNMARRACKGKEAEAEMVVEQRRGTEEAVWIPHPRTGIYFPRGQERVMEDIPSGAASFDCTFWMRGIDGVDHHNLDLPPSFKL